MEPKQAEPSNDVTTTP